MTTKKIHAAVKAKKVLYVGHKKSLRELSRTELDKLTTKRLLGVLRSARACLYSFRDGLYCECCGDRNIDLHGGTEEYKDKVRAQQDRTCDELEKYYTQVKALLKLREHAH